MTAKDDVSVRAAVPGDEAGIADVHVRSWHEAYTGRVAQSLLDRMDVRRRETEWRRHLAHEAPPGGERLGETWVATASGAVIGFATAGPGRDPDRTRADPELYALYVLAAHYGSGTGAALLAASLGDGPASLWVLEDNPRAQAFYAKHGFAADGAVRQDLRFGAPIDEIRMVRPAA